jgi:galactokinase
VTVGLVTALTQQERMARLAFEQRYGRPPTWLASAPGRVNLIGEFTDYNDGFVLPLTLEQRTTITAAPNDSDTIVLFSDVERQECVLPARAQPVADPAGSWSNYLKGVLAGMLQAGFQPAGFDAHITSTLPVGAGLSSSAALEVAFASLLELICGGSIEPVAKALLCQRAEHDYAHVPCGITDQFVSVCGRAGHALLLDCRSLSSSLIPVATDEVALLVINTNVRHARAHSEYPKRRQECAAAAQALGVAALRDASIAMLRDRMPQMPHVVVRRARHVISEIARTLDAAQCLQNKDWPQLGTLLHASHESLRNDFEVSCEELDEIVELADELGPELGVFGCRMTGGGFGGCAVALVDRQARDTIITYIGRGYRERTGKVATFFEAQPADGARAMRLHV